MNPNDPNVVLLELVAQRLGDLRHEFVFVGGAVAGMLITDPAQPAIRPTEDVDLIVQVLARPDYYDVEERLRQQGFSQDLGDLLAVVDGRDTLVDECRGSDPVLRGYLGQRFSALLGSRPFREALPGHLPGDLASQARLPDLEEKLHLLAQLSDAGT